MVSRLAGRLPHALFADASLDDERRRRLTDPSGRVEQLGRRDPTARGVDDCRRPDPDPATDRRTSQMHGEIGRS